MRTKRSKQGYTNFLTGKTQFGDFSGFDPLWMPDFLYGFQTHLTDWSLRKGRSAVFADCGLGKTPIQLVWAENIVRKKHRTGRVLILTPLAVTPQTLREGEKFKIACSRSRKGELNGEPIIITNYERLHYFDPSDFDGIVCDESSILKNFDGVTKAAITEFARTLPFRLLCTATAAPNDYMELGTSSEALGELGFVDMLNRFFKKVESTKSRREEFRGDKWRFRGHSEKDFWRWVCSWARAIRRPSDLGYPDKAFKLPKLITNEYIVKASTPRKGVFFDLPAITLQEQREERRRTLTERCEKAASLVNDTGSAAVCWCHLNDEGNILLDMIPDAEQVAGCDPDERKEELFLAFADGELRVLITKPTIGGFGLNWQHCAHQTFFPSHSFEQWYQAVRRSWRYGQKNPVTVDLITSEGERGVLQNMKRKQKAADKMFEQLIEFMQDEKRAVVDHDYSTKEELPAWL